jgi:hypothetical protein
VNKIFVVLSETKPETVYALRVLKVFSDENLAKSYVGMLQKEDADTRYFYEKHEVLSYFSIKADQLATH